MRSLPFTLPLLLLGFIALMMIESPEPAGQSQQVPIRNLPPDPGLSGVVWISHDWVEPSTVEETDSRRAARRETFGLDQFLDAAECPDPNCRACLIDLVYGREF